LSDKQIRAINSSYKVIFSLAGCWWLTPVILATWEAEIRRIAVRGQTRQKVQETPYQPIAQYGNALLLSQSMQETDIGRIMVPGQSRQKSS
jgi:hypothetical protein